MNPKDAKNMKCNATIYGWDDFELKSYVITKLTYPTLAVAKECLASYQKVEQISKNEFVVFVD